MLSLLVDTFLIVGKWRYFRKPLCRIRRKTDIDQQSKEIGRKREGRARDRERDREQEIEGRERD